MPTYPAKARFLLKQGKATVIQRTPFAIQLTKETTEYTQEIVVGIDDGGIYVGVVCIANDESIYQKEVQLRTDIKSKMDTRRSYRRGRRHRHCRYRQPRFLNRKNSQKSVAQDKTGSTNRYGLYFLKVPEVTYRLKPARNRTEIERLFERSELSEIEGRILTG